MAVDRIYRSGYLNECLCDYIDENGDVKEGTFYIWGYLTRDRAQTRLRKKENNQDIRVKKISRKKMRGSMTMEKFFEMCDSIAESEE